MWIVWMTCKQTDEEWFPVFHSEYYVDAENWMDFHKMFHLKLTFEERINDMATNRKQVYRIRGKWGDVDGPFKNVLAYPLTVGKVRFAVYQDMPKRWILFEVITGLKVEEATTKNEAEKKGKNMVDSVAKIVQKMYTDEADRRKQTTFFSPCANELTHEEYELLRTGTFAD